MLQHVLVRLVEDKQVYIRQLRPALCNREWTLLGTASRVKLKISAPFMYRLSAARVLPLSSSAG